MFAFNQLEQIHLEITSNCQASCPMCVRNVHGGLENPNLRINNWTLDQYKNIISHEVMDQAERIYFCGNFGDPLLNNDLIEMIRYTTEYDPSIHISVHTNGSLRSKAWWEELASVMPKEGFVVLAIDGLEDTHSIYRIGTDYNKIIENAKAYIDAGGRAEWHYIRFKHNEHQVDQARIIAKDLGFEKFAMKDSSRWLMEPKFPVLDKQGNTVYNLEPSQYSTIKIIDKTLVENYKTILDNIEIKCHAKDIKEVYIDSKGILYPCCWLAPIPYQAPERLETITYIRDEIVEQYHDLVKSLGGDHSINANHRSIKDIIDSEPYQTIWDFYWNEAKLITCARSCGVMPEKFSTPQQQFTTRESLTC